MSELKQAYQKLCAAQRALQSAQNRGAEAEAASLAMIVKERQQEYNAAIILHQIRAMDPAQNEVIP